MENERIPGKSIVMLIGLVAVLSGCAANSPVPIAPSPTPTTPSLPASPTTSPTPATPSATATPDSSATNPGSAQTIQEVETRLSKVVSESTGVPIQSVKCPTGAEVAVGSRFDCEAVLDGQTFAIAVEITDVTAPQFKWSTKGLLLTSKLEAYIQKEIKNRSGIDVTTSCGSSIRIANTGETFECQVTDAKGQARSAKVTVKDDQGNVEVSI
jgi:hypothetical protein